MPAKLASKNELAQILSGLAGLNYYKILKLPPTSSETDIREAFHREAVQFHPDQFYSEADAESKELAKQIYTLIVEAYRVLSHEEKRKDYDFKMHGGKSNDDPNATTAIKTGVSSTAEKFFRLAQQAIAGRDLNSAKMNIQIAMNADPDNLHYKHLLAQIENEIKNKKKPTGS